MRNVIDSYFKQLFREADYVVFMVSGVVVMIAFRGNYMSGISVIWDKQFGFLKRALITLVPGGAIILGRIIGNSVVITAQPPSNEYYCARY